MTIDERLAKLQISLPQLQAPAGNYVHGVLTGNLLFLAGKGPSNSVGKVGTEISADDAYQAAREVGLYLLAAIKHEIGSLEKVNRVVKVLGMVNADPTFKDHPAVINGCSDLFVEVFGEQGKHARSAVGMGSLPSNITVEIEAIIEVNDGRL